MGEPAGWSLFANQSSGVLTSAVWADGLVDNPASQADHARRHGTPSCPFAELMS